MTRSINKQLGEQRTPPGDVHKTVNVGILHVEIDDEHAPHRSMLSSRR